tara:strand:- start:477 stop:1259 length:783 start_codon:yes stop_codon:yes gene_type:complete
MIDVLILCAGEGKRLRPLTKDKPKCLIKFKSKSLLDYQLDIIKRNKECKNIYVAVGYKKNKLNRYKKLVKIINVPDFDKKNMLHSLIFSINKIKSKNDLIVSYGDIIFNNHVFKKIIQSNYNISTISHTNFLNFWKERFKKKFMSDLETFKVKKGSIITEVGNKPNSLKDISGQYIGLSKLKKRKIKKILSIYKKYRNLLKLETKHITYFFNLLISKKFIINFIPISKGWLEFDSLSDMKAYNNIKNLKKKGFFDFNEFL